MAAGRVTLLIVPVLILYMKLINGEVLTPPYFNLAQERRIYASSTCGVDVIGEELFCRLTGASSENGFGDRYKEIIQGQYCDVCNPGIAEKRHPPEYAIDGTERWWQSPPLSRGMEYNQVNLTIDLGQEFHVAYVFIKMANSPRPGVWALERSTDFGQSWRPWQYFADTPSDCMKFFGEPADQDIFADNAVICSTEFSKIVPLENGEIVVSLVNNRPSAQNFTYASDLQQWTKATNVRLKLLRTKTLLGHLMAVARQDPTVTRRYFYSVKDISIGGRCVCNGHANTCDRSDSSNPNLLVCTCQHNTCGNQCEYCCPGFVQKKWKPARADKIFMCEPCECYGHATECIYDEEVDRLGLSVDKYGNYEGGGVCQNCQHNTYGVNCDKCVAGYYRPYGVAKNETNACRTCVCDLNVSTGECEEGSGRCLCRPEYTGENCDRCAPGYEGYPTCIPCQCHMNGTEGAVCSLNGLPCPCKENYVGRRCDMCESGFYNFPDCIPCQCETSNGGSVDNNCDVETGQCPCQSNFAGKECNQCAHGYFNYPACTLCDCDPTGTSEEICDKLTGQCLCKENFQFPRCDRCAAGYYSYPTCQECQCAEPGSIQKVCREDGQCPCRPNYGGRTCNRCHPGFYRYPDCSPCNCDRYGSFGESCDQLSGQCQCLSTFDGVSCNKCKEGFYNYPMCEDCNCNPDGAKEIPGYPLGGCGEVIKGQLCECKERVLGRICDQCMPGYYNLDRNNPLGCEECSCYAPGTVAGLNMCNSGTGQCSCKLDVVGRRCDTCASGFYGLSEANPFGCTECDCDSGGSINLRCEQRTGQCLCKPRVGGRRCDIPVRNHFYPTLQQFKYEIEDGQTPEGSRIRYGFDETYFPNFSWRGYAILTAIQPEVEMDIEIKKPSLYRLIYRYVNVNDKVLRGQVMLKPQNPTDVTQNSEVFFQIANEPMFVTVGSGRDYEFVLNPGRWKVSISSPDILLLDYMVLVPDAYYEATVLQEKVTRPCGIPGDQGPCVVYEYPDLQKFPTVTGENGFVIDRNGSQIPTQVFPNQIVLDELGIPTLAQIDNAQRDLNLNLRVPRPGDYVLVFNYFALSNRTQELDVSANVDGQSTTGTVLLYSCQYSVLCRQVMKNIDDMPSVITINDTVQIQVTGDETVDVAIGSVVAIPYDEWSLGYIRPSIICIRINGICVTSGYTIPSSGLRIDFEDPPNADLMVTTLPNYIKETGLIELNSTNRFVELRGNIKNPGQYVILVHFYMPTDAGADLPVTLHTEGFPPITGTFKPRFCPSVTGCRSQIVFDGTLRNVISLQPGNFTIMFNNTMGRNILLDYLMVVPIQQFSPSDLNLQPIDNSAKFLQSCIGPGFLLVNNTEFCRSGIYTLTTDFNNGGLACDCDTDGSLSFECSDFGGQCQCRENVIGQRCTQCREGYYGFPRCKPCNCPYGMCSPVTGECMCPPRVTGERCDACVSATYGFDPLVGCTDCKCNAEGVLNRDMNCDQTTGHCTCKDNVGGRKCDYCLAGFYSFPYCAECSNCNSQGTLEQICDTGNGACLCKENVAAPNCETCESGSFYLDPRNPKGCTKCFCFGTTSRCSSSPLVWTQQKDMLGWDVTNTVEGSLRESETIIAVLESDTKITDPNQPMYWIVSDSYLGDQVKSYGGKMRFEVYYVTPRGNETRELPSGPDVIIKGGNMTLYHRYGSTPLATSTTPVEITMNEYNFVRAEDGLGVSRETFMMVLVDITAIHIRANYFTPTTEVRLMDVELDQAEQQVETTTGVNGDDDGSWFGGWFGDGEKTTTPAPVQLASSVEQCQCPMGYVGSSCQDCAPGYYRSSKTPYRGVCIPCNCHGHSDACDTETGECQSCRDNTMGKHCAECLPGYYGDATTGVCQICSCPLPIQSNNFASGCDVYDGTVYSCDCLPGYTGSRCERCAPGYYGDPTMEGEECRPCQCSGNINMTDPEACSLSSGECLKCLNHTMGPGCAYCQDWYHGDAINLKNCQACTCDQCGSVSCDRESGTCQCQPNVEGPNCDRCKPDTYGFDSCTGCRDCNCGLASASTQCDLVTGQCTCMPGTENRYCDQCIEGYWNYTASGCQECECEEDGAITCDRVTGRCQCLPGVAGDRCDRCLPRYILVANRGCEACDSCVHILLDDIEALQRNISDLSTTMESVSVGMTANNRLEAINNAAINLRPEVDALLAGPQNMSVDWLSQAVTDVKGQAESGKRRSDRLVTQGQFLTDETAQLVKDADDIEVKVTNVKREADDVVQYAVNILKQIYEGIKITNIDTAIQDSRRILEKINSANFTGNAEECNTEEGLVRELLARMRFLFASGKLQSNSSSQIRKEVEDISMRLYDLQTRARNADREADIAGDLIKELNEETISRLQLRLGALEMSEKDTKMLHSMSDNRLSEAQDALDKSRNAATDAETVASQIDAAIVRMRDFVGNLSIGLEEAVIKTNESQEHAQALSNQADFLENIYTDTREISANALNAASAFQGIVDAIEDANNASSVALDAANEALGKSNGVGESSDNSKKNSTSLLQAAKARLDTTEVAMAERLRDAKVMTDDVEGMNNKISQGINDINNQLQDLGRNEFANSTMDAINRAAAAGQRAMDAQGKVGTILSKLPEDKNKIDRLANTVTKTAKSITDATSQGDYVRKNLPEVVTQINLLGQKRESVEALREGVFANLSRLREQIELARDAANRIRVGLEFVGNTSVTLRNPANIDSAGSYSTLSMYVQTRQKRALLAYVGGEAMPNRAQPDYMSLELRNGYPVLRYNLGSGPAEIVSKRDVSDGNWYLIKAKRIGKSGELVVEGDPNKNPTPDIDTGESSGTFTVLALNPQTTKFYVGGVPSTSRLPDSVDSTYYEGVMEEVMFDGKPLGLWNFIAGDNNFKGAIERDVMKSVVSNGFRFNGKGYVKLSASKVNFKPTKESNIVLRFKTYAENGLIFFMGKNRDFMSVEMREGRVLFQYDLGGMPAKLITNETFNDGEWHKIQAQRQERLGALTVDDGGAIKGQSPGSLIELSYTDDIFIGGYNRLFIPIKDVRSQGFDGCVRDLQFNVNKWDLNKNEAAKGVVRGCPEQILRTATFDKDRRGFIAQELSAGVGTNFDVTFRIKTLSDDSMVLYTSNNDQTSGFSVAIVKGRLIVTSDPGGDPTVLESTVNTYNDGNWHYVSIMKMGPKLMMNIDDQEMVNKTGRSGTAILTERPLYIGGTDFTMSEKLVSSTSRFSGCVSDFTINGAFLNFAKIPRQNVRDVAFSECPIADTEVVTTTTVLPTFPTATEAESTDATVAPEEKCRLPPVVDMAAISPGDVEGIKFGDTLTSRYQYVGWKSLRVKFGMMIEFKTTSSGGIILYATDYRKTDFVALIMKEGRLVFSFDCGTGALNLETDQKYNDGKWHTVEFGRFQKTGKISVDGGPSKEGTSIGSTQALNVRRPFFVGGIDPKSQSNEKVKKHLQGVLGSFEGCLRNMKLNDKSFGEPNVTQKVSQCVTNLERGTFFNNQGGYITLYEKYYVGLDFAFNIDIRPRNMSGVILAVHSVKSSSDFILLQLVDGKVIATADNGQGEVITTYTPREENALCDGAWHTISVNKAKNLLLLTVDGMNAPAGTGAKGSSEINSNDPMYIGGVPDFNRRGILVNRNFAGCISNFEIRRGKSDYKSQYLSSGDITGDVTLNKCPLN